MELLVKFEIEKPASTNLGSHQVQARIINISLTLVTFRSLAPARAAARPEMGRSSAGENRPAGRGGAGGGGGAPGGGVGSHGEVRVPPALSVDGSGGSGGGGGGPVA